MRHAAALFLLPFLCAACGQEQTRWLAGYQHTQCAYARLQDQIKQAQARATAPAQAHRRQLAAQLAAQAAPYGPELAALRADSSNQQRRYQQAYRQLTDRQSEQYGHVSTPGYEQALARLAQARDRTRHQQQARRQALHRRLLQAPGRDALRREVAALDRRLRAAARDVPARYRHPFDSLQHVLTRQGLEYQALRQHLDTAQQTALATQRDRIRAAPCPAGASD